MLHNSSKLKVKLIAQIKHIFYFGAFQDMVLSVIYYFYKRKCISAKVEDITDYCTQLYDFNITK